MTTADAAGAHSLGGRPDVLLDARRLRRVFDGEPAVDGVDLTVARGEGMGGAEAASAVSWPQLLAAVPVAGVGWFATARWWERVELV